MARGGASRKTFNNLRRLLRLRSLKIFRLAPENAAPAPDSVRARKRRIRPNIRSESPILRQMSLRIGVAVAIVPGAQLQPSSRPWASCAVPHTGRESSGVSRGVGVLMTRRGCIALAVEDSRLSPGPGGL